MKYYLIAGEASGDLHGANLMKALKKLDSNAEFRFFGGDKMKAQGGTLVKHFSEMAYMGVIEVIANIRSIYKNINLCKADIINYQPDVVILIDFPGFNLRMASFAKEHHFKTFYYIAPKVWAWNTKRVFKIKKVVDALFCILPFEIDFFKSHHVNACYVGNPLLDEIDNFRPNANFLTQNQLPADKKIIALLPGSREQEIKAMLPEMVKIQEEFPDYQFVIAATNNFDTTFYEKFSHGISIPLVFNQTYDLLKHASAALVASGTATLETALFNVPQVVLYKGNYITVKLGRMLIKIKYLSLVNLIIDEPLVKELIQEECNKYLISIELNKVLNTEKRHQILEGYHKIQTIMGASGASEKAANEMWRLLNS